MSNSTSTIVSKVCPFCNPLRDVGVGYGDYPRLNIRLEFFKIMFNDRLLNIAAGQRNIYRRIIHGQLLNIAAAQRNIYRIIV